MTRSESRPYKTYSSECTDQIEFTAKPTSPFSRSDALWEQPAARSPQRFSAAQALQGLCDPEKKTHLLASLAKPCVVRSPSPEPDLTPAPFPPLTPRVHQASSLALGHAHSCSGSLPAGWHGSLLALSHHLAPFRVWASGGLSAVPFSSAVPRPQSRAACGGGAQ